VNFEKDDEYYVTQMGDTQCKYCEGYLHFRCIYHFCGDEHRDKVEKLLCDDNQRIIIIIGEKEKRRMYEEIWKLPWKKQKKKK
jgi:hypothetical protein